MWILITKYFTYVPKYTRQRYLTMKPRVRYAPSPTGYLHLGGLRTALYNYLFAKSQNGSFILRIEDTDQTRKVDDGVEALVRDLEWAGIQFDEGPTKGGPLGPYVQSKRVDIYKEHIKTLLSNGSAYYCFCSPRRLQMLRTDAASRNLVSSYDNRCRNLTGEEITQKLKQTISHCIRFKLSPDAETFEDMVCGRKEMSLTEGDPVIMKEDGLPTYHFANVVDDHLMRVTHVLRGMEWLVSTAKHLMIYRAFGWSPPKYGHLPLIMRSDGAKLSKRQDDVRVEQYRNTGIYPLALINYLMVPNSEVDRLRAGDYRIKTTEELANEFQLSQVSHHIDQHHPDLLNQCNRAVLKWNLTDDKIGATVSELRHLIRDTYPNETLSVSDGYIENVLRLTTPWVTKLQDLVASEFAFLWVLQSQPSIQVEKEVLQKLVEHLEQLEKFDQGSVDELIERFAKENKVKLSYLMKTLRSVLSGWNSGPRVREMMELLGKDQSLERIKIAIKYFVF